MRSEVGGQKSDFGFEVREFGETDSDVRVARI